MANVFKRYDSTASIAGTASYTVPASTVAVIIGFTLANEDTEQRTATIDIAGTSLIQNAPIPAYSTLSVLDGKIVVGSSEVVTVYSDADSVVDVMISVLEQS